MICFLIHKVCLLNIGVFLLPLFYCNCQFNNACGFLSKLWLSKICHYARLYTKSGNGFCLSSIFFCLEAQLTFIFEFILLFK